MGKLADLWAAFKAAVEEEKTATGEAKKAARQKREQLAKELSDEKKNNSNLDSEDKAAWNEFTAKSLGELARKAEGVRS